jgi:hypothetical protein
MTAQHWDKPHADIPRTVAGPALLVPPATRLSAKPNRETLRDSQARGT